MTTVKKSTKMKFKKAPGAPKRFKSAYMFFSEQMHKVIRLHLENKKMRAAEVAKMVSQSWKGLTDEERLPWLEMGRRDRERYEQEKANYKGPWKVPDIKDPKAPKKPMSAFLAFSNERRKIVAQANPLMTGTEISSLMSQLWKECPDHMKQSYRDKEARERELFKQDRAAWERKKEAMMMENSSVTSLTDTSSSCQESSSEPTQQEQQEHDQYAPTSFTPLEKVLLGGNASPVVPTNTAAIPEGSTMEKMQTAFSRMQNDTIRCPSLSKGLVSQKMDDDFLPEEAWPFNRVPCTITMPASSSSSRFDNYSLEDVLQDDELFEDFSPRHIPIIASDMAANPAETALLPSITSYSSLFSY